MTYHPPPPKQNLQKRKYYLKFVHPLGKTSTTPTKLADKKNAEKTSINGPSERPTSTPPISSPYPAPHVSPTLTPPRLGTPSSLRPGEVSTPVRNTTEMPSRRLDLSIPPFSPHPSPKHNLELERIGNYNLPGAKEEPSQQLDRSKRSRKATDVYQASSIIKSRVFTKRVKFAINSNSFNV